MATGDAKEYLALTVTSNLNNIQCERRFPSDIPIISLKGKLELLTGASCQTMKLELWDQNNELVQKLTDDTLTLSQVGMKSGMKVHVTDSSNNFLDDDDAPDVAFQYSSEDYEKKDDSIRNFLKKNKLGQYDEEKNKQREEEKLKEKDIIATMKVGDRCEVTTLGQPTRRGEVKYLGEVHFKEGLWVGVQYDEPMGKNNGSVEGKKYFECPPKYGGFVRPNTITVGDFPELGIDDMDEI